MDNESIIDLLLTLYGELKLTGFEFKGQLKIDFDSAVKYLSDEKKSSDAILLKVLSIQKELQDTVEYNLIPTTQKIDEIRSKYLSVLLWAKSDDLIN